MDGPRRRPATAACSMPLVLLLSVFLWSCATADGDDASMTALQKHAAFFDRNKDGIITLTETYEGLRALGLGFVLSTFSAAFINGALGPQTRPENATSPRLSIYIENIQNGIHGSDTGSYDAEGRFVPEKFEEIFTKYAKTTSVALTSNEIDEMLRANRQPKDYKGWIGASTEWKLLYNLCKDKDGLLHKDDARGVYDGSLFVKLEQERGSSQKKA